MTRTTSDPHHAWTQQFTAELRLRHVEDQHVHDAVGRLREHLTGRDDDRRRARHDHRGEPLRSDRSRGPPCRPHPAEVSDGR